MCPQCKRGAECFSACRYNCLEPCHMTNKVQQASTSVRHNAPTRVHQPVRRTYKALHSKRQAKRKWPKWFAAMVSSKPSWKPGTYSSAIGFMRCHVPILALLNSASVYDCQRLLQPSTGGRQAGRGCASGGEKERPSSRKPEGTWTSPGKVEMVGMWN